MPTIKQKPANAFTRTLSTATILTFVLTFVLSSGLYPIPKAEASSTPQLDIHYVPTPHGLVQRMLEMAQVNENDYVVDLGSGDGRIVIAAVKDFNARAGLGIDLDPQRIAEAKENATKAEVADRVVFEQGDLFEKDFSDATVVTLYLLHSLNMRLRPTILEMTPGTRVVSHAFDMGNWEPDMIDSVDGSNAFLWIVPAKVDGTWQMTHDDQTTTLHLTQTFQKIDGYAVTGRSRTRIGNATLSGDEIRFTINSDLYVGTVKDDAIVPVKEEGSIQDWHADRS